MERTPGQEGNLVVRFEVRPDDPEGLHGLHCLGCGKALDVHQPDAEVPDRMLATCEGCKGWHLVEFTPGRPGALVVLLPDVSGLRPSSTPRPAPSRRRRPH